MGSSVLNDLIQAVGDLKAGLATLLDPVAGGPGLASAVATARTFSATPGGPGLPAPNLDLLPPSDGVPRPPADREVGPAGLTGPEAPAVALPLPAPGPAGPPGDPGPTGPPGPPGPGVDPDRIATLEQALADLQELTLTALALGGS